MKISEGKTRSPFFCSATNSESKEVKGVKSEVTTDKSTWMEFEIAVENVSTYTADLKAPLCGTPVESFHSGLVDILEYVLQKKRNLKLEELLTRFPQVDGTIVLSIVEAAGNVEDRLLVGLTADFLTFKN